MCRLVMGNPVVLSEDYTRLLMVAGYLCAYRSKCSESACCGHGTNWTWSKVLK